jgi:hypothetical protein
MNSEKEEAKKQVLKDLPESFSIRNLPPMHIISGSPDVIKLEKSFSVAESTLLSTQGIKWLGAFRL